jgi:hypothetical protein
VESTAENGAEFTKDGAEVAGSTESVVTDELTLGNTISFETYLKYSAMPTLAGGSSNIFSCTSSNGVHDIVLKSYTVDIGGVDKQHIAFSTGKEKLHNKETKWKKWAGIYAVTYENGNSTQFTISSTGSVSVTHHDGSGSAFLSAVTDPRCPGLDPARKSYKMWLSGKRCADFLDLVSPGVVAEGISVQQCVAFVQEHGRDYGCAGNTALYNYNGGSGQRCGCGVDNCGAPTPDTAWDTYNIVPSCARLHGHYRDEVVEFVTLSVDKLIINHFDEHGHPSPHGKQPNCPFHEQLFSVIAMYSMRGALRLGR